MQIESPHAMSVHTAPNSSGVFDFGNSKLTPWLMLNALLAGLAIGIAILAVVLSQQSERETKLAREDLRVMAIALARHNINTDEHAIEKGEQP